MGPDPLLGVRRRPQAAPSLDDASPPAREASNGTLQPGGSSVRKRQSAVRARCGAGLDVVAAAIFLAQPCLALLAPGALAAVPGAAVRAVAALGALLLARRLLCFPRWRDEHAHVPRFTACFLAMLAELAMENCAV
ncbi:hypothetical protein TSOC_013713, partial [Tetrabaena socialis]